MSLLNITRSILLKKDDKIRHPEWHSKLLWMVVRKMLTCQPKSHWTRMVNDESDNVILNGALWEGRIIAEHSQINHSTTLSFEAAAPQPQFRFISLHIYPGTCQDQVRSGREEGIDWRVSCPRALFPTLFILIECTDIICDQLQFAFSLTFRITDNPQKTTALVVPAVLVHSYICEM